MMSVTRRELCSGISAVIAAGLVGGAGAQVHATESPAPKGSTPAWAAEHAMDGTPGGTATTGSAGTLSEAKVYAFDSLPTRTSANGSVSRDVLRGVLPTGEGVTLHESMQPAGAAPVALHVIHHTELICVREGEVTFDHVDASGKTLSETVGAGGVILVALGTNHRIRNSGAGPASYFVVAIGGDAR